MLGDLDAVVLEVASDQSRSVTRRVIVVENPGAVSSELGSNSSDPCSKPFENFPVELTVHGLPWRNEFMMNNAPDVKNHNEHCFHLRPRFLALHWASFISESPLGCLGFAFVIKLVEPGLVSCDDPLEEVRRLVCDDPSFTAGDPKHFLIVGHDFRNDL